MGRVTIVKASPGQRRVSLQNHYHEWGAGRYTLDEYFARLESLADPSAPWNKQGHTTWALVPAADPSTEDILASCETFSNTAVVLPPGGKAFESVTYGVAAVCTPRKNRGNGYARQMLQLLHYLLAAEEHLPPFPEEWGSPPDAALRLAPARISTLQSGIGEVFYAKCRKGLGEGSEPGWIWQGVPSRVWEGPFGGNEAPSLTFITRDDIAHWEAEATRRIRRDLNNTGDETKTRVAILPEPGWFQVHVKRYDMLPRPRRDATFGIVLPATNGEHPFMIYTFSALQPGVESPPERLVVTFVSGDVPWAAVAAAAAHEGVSSVEKWGHDAWSADADSDATTVVIGSSMAQYGFGGDDNVDWEWDDK